MKRLAVLRHFPTLWNLEKRYQGRTDRPLLDRSKSQLGQLRLPGAFAGFEMYSSPLQRATGTIEGLHIFDYNVENALVECDYGKWEGMTAPEILNKYELSNSGYDGLDYKDHGGESIREVQARVLKWALSLKQDSFAVTHKGVINALYALATDWLMLSSPDHKLNFSQIQIFSIEDGRVRLNASNQPLASRE